MPTERLSMRKIKEILRLHAAGHSQHQISRGCGVARGAVGQRLQRAGAAGLSWPLPESLDEAALERQLFPKPMPAAAPRPMLEWTRVHQEPRRPGVTLWLLWQEYKAVYPDGYQHTRFCQHYRTWAAQTDVVMRQTHRAGEALFVDYAGQTVPIVDRSTGVIRPAMIFMAMLGASNYTDIQATWSQGLDDWLMAHVRAFEFFGGVPAVLVPDNLKAGVDRAHRYEPVLNPSYTDLAAH